MNEINDIVPIETDANERRAFEASEMVRCSGCSRANPPTRANCLYCGAALAAAARKIRAEAPATVSEAGTEPALHVVALPSNLDETALTKATALIELSTVELGEILKSAKGAPVFSTADPARADLVSRSLRDVGIETITISDEKLDLVNAARDLRTLELTDDSLAGLGRHGAERVSARWEDLFLIVLGRLQITTVEIEQKQGGRILTEREFSADEAVIDVYSRDHAAGWRIRSGSFDFSFLGDRKAMTAFENFNALTDLLRRQGPNADFDDSHLRLKSVLARVWPPETGAGRTERRRTTTRDFEAKITSSDNEAQFNRYSRLLAVLSAPESSENA